MKRDDGRNRTCVSGGCSSAPLPLGHVVVVESQFSRRAPIDSTRSTFTPALSRERRGSETARRTGIEPVASRFGGGRPAIGASGVSKSTHSAQGGNRTPVRHLGCPGYSRVHDLSATCAAGTDIRVCDFKSAWKDSNLRPRAPEARALAKLRYTLRTNHAPGENRTLACRLKTGGPATRRREQHNANTYSALGGARTHISLAENQVAYSD